MLVFRHQDKRMRVKRYFYWLLTFLIALYFAIFAVKNGANVTLDFWPFGWELQTSLSLLILITFIIGVVVGGAIVWWTEWIKRHKERKKTIQRESEQ